MTLSPASGPGHPNGRWGRLPQASHLGHLPCPFSPVSPIPVRHSSSPFPGRLVPVPNPARPTLFSFAHPCSKKGHALPSALPVSPSARPPALPTSLQPPSQPPPPPPPPPTVRHTPTSPISPSFSPSFPFARALPRSICSLFRSSLALLSGPPLASRRPEPVPAYSRLSRRCAL